LAQTLRYVANDTLAQTLSERDTLRRANVVFAPKRCGAEDLRRGAGANLAFATRFNVVFALNRGVGFVALCDISIPIIHHIPSDP
ncbi:MAG: hypothetical protein KGI11_09680, partial [Thaumarchaeota archaeon]|nr:hypothetical protein [Nitrososphaerota archaeon]